MPNARNLRLEPNATYIPLTCIGALRWGKTFFRFGVVGNVNLRVFRYQCKIVALGGLSQRQDSASMVLRCSGI